MSGFLAILLIGGALAARPAAAATADPPTEADRQAGLQAAGVRADAALERLQVRLESAVDSARMGSALVVSGQDPPGPRLNSAAAILDEARGEASAGAMAMADLAGILTCVRPGVAALPGVGVDVDDLVSIAAQLRDSAVAANAFVERRRSTEATLAALAGALAAFDRNDTQGALAALDLADAALEEVMTWEEPPASLQFWVDTTRALVAAARGIADAALAGDPAAAAIAAAAYRTAAEEASRADRALALAVAEAGSAVVANPLRRLTNALAGVIALRVAVASVIHP